MRTFVRLPLITTICLLSLVFIACGGGGGGDGDTSATYYADADGDGFGDAGNSQVLDSAQAGWVLDSTDCDDTPGAGTSINPGESEICNDLDDDCTGGIDDNGAGGSLAQACYTGSLATRNVGVCSDGTQTCGSGSWGSCVGETLPDTETCDNNDNDCDGTVDENYYAGGTVTYTDLDGTSGLVKDDSCGTGDCAGGTVICSASGTDLDCSTAGSAASESCDSADNDCNGVIDDSDVCSVDSGGVPSSGYPYWQERTMLVVVNAVRMDPTGWRDTYYPYTGSLPSGGGILMPGIYPAVPPLYYHNGLNQAARYHSEDMRDNCGLQHDSCDGTIWSTRIRSYYTSASVISENASFGYGSPLDAVNQYLCDKSGSFCAADGSGSDGHRANIMRSTSKEVGMGFASPYWWTQDFAWATGEPSWMPVIVAGSHVMTGTTLTYFANYYAPADSAQGVDLILEGTPAAMGLDMGTLDAGTWSVTAATASSCQSYYFEGTDSVGQVWRYPGEGEFRTYGIGSCTEDYQAP